LLLRSAQLMGLHLSVFARGSVALAGGGTVELGNVATGVLGSGFNKGGLALRRVRPGRCGHYALHASYLGLFYCI
jgi:hypothetical protein